MFKIMMKTTYDALMKEVEEAKATESYNKSLENMNDEIRIKKGNLEERLKTTENERDALEANLDKLVKGFGETEKAWEIEMKNIKADYKIKSAKNKKRYDALKPKHEDLQKRHSDLALDRANLKKSLDKLTTDHSLLQAKYDALTDRNDLGQFVKTEPIEETCDITTDPVKYATHELPDVD